MQHRTIIGLSWAAFCGTHLLLEAEPVRSRVVKAVGGEQPFKALYSVVSFATLGPALYYAIRFRRSAVPTGWKLSRGVRLVGTTLNTVGLIGMAQGLAAPSPYAMGMEHGDDAAAGHVRGVLRITRHPLDMSMILVGLGSLINAVTWNGVMNSSGLAITALLTTLHQDVRKRKEMSPRILESTSLVPFQAVLEGRQSLAAAFTEMNVPALVAALALGSVIKFRPLLFRK